MLNLIPLLPSHTTTERSILGIKSSRVFEKSTSLLELSRFLQALRVNTGSVATGAPPPRKSKKPSRVDPTGLWCFGFRVSFFLQKRVVAGQLGGHPTGWFRLKGNIVGGIPKKVWDFLAQSDQLVLASHTYLTANQIGEIPAQ